MFLPVRLKLIKELSKMFKATRITRREGMAREMIMKEGKTRMMRLVTMSRMLQLSIGQEFKLILSDIDQFYYYSGYHDIYWPSINVFD